MPIMTSIGEAPGRVSAISFDAVILVSCCDAFQYAHNAYTWPPTNRVVPPARPHAKAHLLLEAAAKRSNCLVCQGGLCMLCARHLRRLPRGLVLHHSRENRQELAHAGRQRDLRRFATRPQVFIKPFEYRVVPNRNERTHIQGGPDMGATTTDRPAAPQGASVSMKGSNTDQGCNALAAQGAQRWQVEQQGTGTHGANARHTAEQCLTLAPDWTGTQSGIQILIEARQACVEPRNMRL